MTDQEINIAIAEACGWSRLKQPIRINRGYQGYGNAFWQNAVGVPYIECPNYCNDLNAMHEAEVTLKESDYGKYLWWLEFILKLGHISDGCITRHISTEITLVHSTARQRAEAWLRTLGKWKD